MHVTKVSVVTNTLILVSVLRICTGKKSHRFIFVVSSAVNK